VSGSKRGRQPSDQATGHRRNPIADQDLAARHVDQPHLHQILEMYRSTNPLSGSAGLGDTQQFSDCGWA
jgi:hypothetical protein